MTITTGREYYYYKQKNTYTSSNSLMDVAGVNTSNRPMICS